jgi:hypothetical protein
MELSFATEELRSLCESRRRSKKRLGELATRGLEQLLADIEACSHLGELVELFPDNVVPICAEQWSVTIGDDYQVTLASGHVVAPVTAEGRIDWHQVVRVRIDAIEVKT